MACCHYYQLTDSGDTSFSIDPASVTFGPGALAEVGDHVRARGCRRVALYTDKVVVALPHVALATDSLRRAGVDVAIFDEVQIEPSDQSFLLAARFAAEGRFDGFVSVGGGSVMDTCKAAILYATYPAPVLHYVNPPLGEGRAVPGPLPPHIACPTTSGTGSECTGIAVCEVLAQRLKIGISHRPLRPSMALIDPATTATLPGNVVAASGFDVLSHALESYTALPYTRRARPDRPSLRPMNQGANPWSDLGSLEALRLCGRYLLRAVADAADTEARQQMMYAATLAGIAFGNAGVHIPHGMAYAVAARVRDFRMAGYPPDKPLVPHGISVILSAPSAFRFTAPACPGRHLAATAALGAETRGAAPEDAGEVLAGHLLGLMRATALPNGLSGIGYGAADIQPLSEATALQTRLLRNSPREIGPDGLSCLADLFRGALTYH